jgi:regulator of cell morphogenesis and NO signaling
MENVHTLSLGEIVKMNYKAAAVFERFALDFCCMGDRNLLEACKEENIQPSQIINELLSLATGDGLVPDFATWSLEFLIDYICENHHKYIEKKTPVLRANLDKLCQVHGTQHPELFEIRSIFFETSSGLAMHMKKEELMLFPYIKKLERAKALNRPVSSPLFKSVKDLIEIMKGDHSQEGQEFRRIASLSNNYEIPSDACSTFEVTYRLLDEFEKDLHVHIHLENNILFPEAIRIEELLNSRT